jgi:MFS family permease
MASLSPAETASPQVAADRWTAYSVTVWAICMLGFAFDIYEGTIMQLATPLLIKEWGIAPATIGNITTVSRWVGLIGVFVFPTLADLYGRRPILVLTILGYSLLTGLTGFAQGPLQLLIFTSITRITLQGETPVGMIMVSETAPTKWRATALGGLVGGYPFGYMLCSLTALVVVPLWGWRSLYWLGILPALLVLWVRLGVKESPRFEHVTTAMLKEGLKKRRPILPAGLFAILFQLASWRDVPALRAKHRSFLERFRRARERIRLLRSDRRGPAAAEILVELRARRVDSGQG